MEIALCGIYSLVVFVSENSLVGYAHWFVKSQKLVRNYRTRTLSVKLSIL